MKKKMSGKLFVRLGLVLLGIMVVFILAILLFPQTSLSWLARQWVVHDGVGQGKSDAIVVLGGGVPFRPNAAAKLYHRGAAPLIVVLRPEPVQLEDQEKKVLPGYVEQQEETLGILKKAQVPEKAILALDSYVYSTKDEAVQLIALAKEKGWKQLLIPTNAFHTRRTKWVFEQEAQGSGVECRVIALKLKNYSTEDWWEKEEGLITFQNEVVKMVYYLFRY